MKQITVQEFLAKAEAGSVTEIFAVVKRVYGIDHSYDFARAQAGKSSEMVYCDVP